MSKRCCTCASDPTITCIVHPHAGNERKLSKMSYLLNKVAVLKEENERLKENLKSTPRIKLHELEDEIIRRLKSVVVDDTDYQRLLEFRNLAIPFLLLEENNDEV